MTDTIAVVSDLFVIIASGGAVLALLSSGIRKGWSTHIVPMFERLGINALMVLIVIISLAVNVAMLAQVSRMQGRIDGVTSAARYMGQILEVHEDRLKQIEDADDQRP